MERKKAKSRSRKWNETYIIKAFEFAREGLRGTALAQAIGIDISTLNEWKRDHEGFKYAIEYARSKHTKTSKKGAMTDETFQDYVLGRLPDNLKVLWNKIHEYQYQKNGVQMIEAMLAKNGDYTRMQLFVYALIKKNFNVTGACRIVNISLDKFEAWCTMYPEFQRMLGYIKEYKKDFVEEALMKLIKQGESAAVIFANKTLNRDRGYNDKVDINLSGNIGQTHLIDISVLNLPTEVKRQILEAWRQHKETVQSQQHLEYKRVGDKAVPVTTDGQETDSEAA